MFFLERTPGRGLRLWAEAFAAHRWTRPCFSRRKIDASIGLAAARPDGTPVPIFRPRFQRPNSVTLSHFRPVFSAPKVPRIQGKKARHPLPRPAGGVLILEPIWERPAGPKHTRAEQDRKLGQLHCARQGLVRVPESNTKYGGKGGKQGVTPALCTGQVSVSPQGFPSEKNCLRGSGVRLRPAVHRATIYCARGVALGDSRASSRGVPGWHARRPIAAGPR